MARVKQFFKQIERGLARTRQWANVQYLLHCAGWQQVVDSYRSRACAGEAPIPPDAPIWTCWWQGEEAMPDIAKACYQAMKRFAGSHPVILVTGQNWREYTSLPDYIVDKQRSGVIDLTHFSDILRMKLLSEHGGIWMDSTLLPVKPIDTFILPGMSYWSCHHHTRYHNISKGGWVSFFVACSKGHILPSFIVDAHLAYWKGHNRLIDYLLLDYAFAVARRYLPVVHDLVEQTPYSEMGPLGKCMNGEYNAEQWRMYCTRYDFHKLTYKVPVSRCTQEGRLTWYGHILDEFGVQRG